MRGRPFQKGFDARRHLWDSEEARRARAARFARKVVDELGLQDMQLPETLPRSPPERVEQAELWVHA